jgi:LuxR family maltose regulon positive regulatory protein
LLAQWAASHPHPVAWLTLDTDDGEPERFLSYLMAALQQATALQSSAWNDRHPAGGTPTAILASVINELTSQTAPLTLVLDDYHLAATPAVNQILTHILTYQPPQLRMMIATREEPPLPLARLRARGQLCELRAPDLRLSDTEAGELLHQIPGLHLSAATIAILAERTEGWAAGLQLAALSLRHQHDTDRVVRSFSGRDRFVLDYLLEEVFTQQPPAIQQFLLHTAILDRLCGPLCDAMLATPPGSSQAHLEAIAQANLFLQPLDSERRWYRYHHLFGEFLRQRLPTAGINPAPLHLRASGWYASHDLDLAALQHASAAGDHARVASLAEQSWQRLDLHFQLAAWCRSVAQLPEEVRRVRPVLMVQYAWALLDTGAIAACEAQLQAAEYWLHMPETNSAAVVVAEEQFETLPARIAVARAYLAQVHNDTDATERYAAQALADPAIDPLLRAQAASLRGAAAWAHGDLAVAAQAMSAWMTYSHQSGNHTFAYASAFYLAEICMHQGRLREAERICQQYLGKLAEDPHPADYAAAHLQLGLALLAYQRADSASADQHLQHSQSHAAKAALIDWPFRYRIAQAHMAAAAEDWERAFDLIDQAEQQYLPNPAPDHMPRAALRARLQLRQGDAAAAYAWEAHLGILPLTYQHEYSQLTRARVWITRYRQEQALADWQQADRLLRQLYQTAKTSNRSASQIEILLLQALLCDASPHRQQEQQALAALEQALALAAPEGFVRLFSDEGSAMLQLLSKRHAQRNPAHDRLRPFSEQIMATLHESLGPLASNTPVEPLIEPLTEREREVLQLIAQGLSNQDLAERLYISLQTVKVHTRNIYGKLGVSSRTQAIARGRALGQLPEA